MLMNQFRKKKNSDTNLKLVFNLKLFLFLGKPTHFFTVSAKLSFRLNFVSICTGTKKLTGWASFSSLSKTHKFIPQNITRPELDMAAAVEMFAYSTLVLLDTGVNSVTYFKASGVQNTEITELRAKIWNVGLLRQLMFISAVLFWNKSLASRFTKSIYLNVIFGLFQAYYSSDNMKTSKIWHDRS